MDISKLNMKNIICPITFMNGNCHMDSEFNKTLIAPFINKVSGDILRSKLMNEHEIKYRTFNVNTESNYLIFRNYMVSQIRDIIFNNITYLRKVIYNGIELQINVVDFESMFNITAILETQFDNLGLRIIYGHLAYHDTEEKDYAGKVLTTISFLKDGLFSTVLYCLDVFAHYIAIKDMDNENTSIMIAFHKVNKVKINKNVKSSLDSNRYEVISFIRYLLEERLPKIKDDVDALCNTLGNMVLFATNAHSDKQYHQYSKEVTSYLGRLDDEG